MSANGRNTITPQKQPVFLHTLFRSGGTYVWSKFRQSSRFTTYYEPFNEILLDYRRDQYAQIYEDIRMQMRHADVKQEYFAEYPVDDTGHIAGFRAAFPYERFALSPTEADGELKIYLDYLIATATGQPVLKFCRSLLRLDWLDNHYSPLNIAVIRNPRDQWQSFNSFKPGYFHAIHLLLTAQFAAHPLVKPLSQLGPMPIFPGGMLKPSIEFYQLLARHLDHRFLYIIFYHWWCISILELLPRMDVLIDVDQEDHHDLRQAQLQRLGLDLDLSDCRPQRYESYGLSIPEFERIERAVELNLIEQIRERINPAAEALKKHGYLSGTRICSWIERMKATAAGPFGSDTALHSQDWLKSFHDILPACIAELFDQMNQQAEHISGQAGMIKQLEAERENAKEYIASLVDHASRLRNEIDAYPKTLKDFVLSKWTNKNTQDC
jgi:hypothetical protein